MAKCAQNSYKLDGLERRYERRPALTTMRRNRTMADTRIGRRRRNTEADFWARTVIRGPDECWPWVGAKEWAGYGKFCMHDKSMKANTWALIIAGVPRPDRPNHLALHSCDNRLCVNPSHLRWGSHQDNANDRTQRRGNYSRLNLCGKTQSVAKLDAVSAREVFLAEGRHKDIAEKYGVSRTLVGSVKNLKVWAHVNG